MNYSKPFFFVTENKLENEKKKFNLKKHAKVPLQEEVVKCT